MSEKKASIWGRISSTATGLQARVAKLTEDAFDHAEDILVSGLAALALQISSSRVHNTRKADLRRSCTLSQDPSARSQQQSAPPQPRSLPGPPAPPPAAAAAAPPASATRSTSDAGTTESRLAALKAKLAEDRARRSAAQGGSGISATPPSAATSARQHSHSSQTAAQQRGASEAAAPSHQSAWQLGSHGPVAHVPPPVQVAAKPPADGGGAFEEVSLSSPDSSAALPEQQQQYQSAYAPTLHGVPSSLVPPQTALPAANEVQLSRPSEDEVVRLRGYDMQHSAGKEQKSTSL